MFSYPQKEPIKSAYSDNQILPRSTLGYATNNIYHNMPPRMDDSRSLVAAYQPEAVLNESLLNKSGVKSNWEYRKYLTEHSQEIAKDNFREAANDVGYFERFTPNERGYQSQTHGTPITGANYKESSTILNENSDLKNLYLTREELQQKREPVVLTQDQLFSHLAK
tara:strand:+ start:1730 stop:2227 length:498 start_codon:yes stop_codon:yes gene_type:complete